MIGDLDTRSGELYAPVDDVLPAGGGEPAVAQRSSGFPERLLGKPGQDAFVASRELFDAELLWLGGEEAAGLSHSELENRLLVSSRELHRQLLDDHLGLRADQESRIGEVRTLRGSVTATSRRRTSARS